MYGNEPSYITLTPSTKRNLSKNEATSNEVTLNEPTLNKATLNETSFDNEPERENIHQYFMNIAHAVKTRSTCIKRKVGAIIVKNKKIVSTGYNNPSVGLANCTKHNCILDANHKCVKAIHSEVNAILQATPDERIGATMYVTTQPCNNCQLAILNSGITTVIYDEEHMPEYNFFVDTHVTCKSLKEVLGDNYGKI